MRSTPPRGDVIETGERADLPMTAPELPPPPKKRRRVWPWVLLAVLVVWIAIPVIRLAVTYSNQHSDSRSFPVGVEGAPGASDELSAHDQSVIVDIALHIQRFNSAALPLVTGYSEDVRSVPSRSARRHITEMWNATTAMVADTGTIEDDGLREILVRVSSTLGEEVQAMIELYGVFPPGTPASVQDDYSLRCFLREKSCERQALRHLRRAAEKRQELGIELLDRLRPYVDPATLREILQSAADQGT